MNLGLHQRDVSVIWDLGPHDFSILLYWLDELPETVARGRTRLDRPGHPRRRLRDAELRLRASLANVELSWLAPSKLRRTVLVGSEKMVVYEDGAPEPVRVFDHGVVYRDPETFGEYHLSYRTGRHRLPEARHEPSRSRSSSPTSSRRSGEGRADQARSTLARDVVRLIEAAEDSLRDGGAPVRVEAGAASTVPLAREPPRASSRGRSARRPGEATGSPTRGRASAARGARASSPSRPSRRATTTCAGPWRRPT